MRCRCGRHQARCEGEARRQSSAGRHNPSLRRGGLLRRTRCILWTPLITSTSPPDNITPFPVPLLAHLLLLLPLLLAHVLLHAHVLLLPLPRAVLVMASTVPAVLLFACIYSYMESSSFHAALVKFWILVNRMPGANMVRRGAFRRCGVLCCTHTCGIARNQVPSRGDRGGACPCIAELVGCTSAPVASWL